jgi:hypothetical protein
MSFSFHVSRWRSRAGTLITDGSVFREHSTRNWSPIRSTTRNPVSRRSLEPIAKRAA